MSAHFGQISSARAMELIAEARRQGLPVTADIAAHHLYLTELDVSGFNADCHVRPPLRSQRDRDGLRRALNHDFVAICSDHQPHDPDAKLAPFGETEPGISGLDTLLPLALRLADERVLPLGEAVAALTHRPATILGRDSGHLAIGATADVTVVDPDSYWTVEEDTLASAGKNTPFRGWELKGRTTHTLLAGRPVHEPDA